MASGRPSATATSTAISSTAIGCAGGFSLTIVLRPAMHTFVAPYEGWAALNADDRDRRQSSLPFAGPPSQFVSRLWRPPRPGVFDFEWALSARTSSFVHGTRAGIFVLAINSAPLALGRLGHRRASG